MTFPMSRGLLQVLATVGQIAAWPAVEMTFPMSRGLLQFGVAAGVAVVPQCGGNDLPDE